MSRLKKTVIPFTWSNISATFTNGTAGTVAIAPYLSNPQKKTITYSVVGSLPSGVTFSGSTLSYNGSGAASASSVRFRATSGSLVADSALAPITIQSAQAVNQPPVWSGTDPIALTGTYLSGTAYNVPLAGYASDPNGNPLVFGRSGTAGDTAPASFTISAAGTLAIPAGATGGSYQIIAEVLEAVSQPVGLNAVAVSYASVSITWNATFGATSYVIERSLTGSSGWAALSPAPTTPAYTDSNVNPSTTYYYRVAARNSLQTSIYSATRSATTPAVPSAGDRFEFADIPELVFVEGYAENEELGLYILDPQRRTQPGDLWWQNGSRLHDLTGVAYAPRVPVSIATATPPTGWTDAGTAPSGVTFEAATGRILYNGASQSAAVKDWWVQLSAAGATSKPFRIRVLRPKYVWGDNASAVNAARGWGAITQDASVTFQAFETANNPAVVAARDATPAVFFITPGTYTNYREYFITNKRAVYLLGDPSNRPVVQTLRGSIYAVETYYAPAVTWYIKNFAMQDHTCSLGAVDAMDPNSLYRLFVQKVSNGMFNQVGSAVWDVANQEGDGGASQRVPLGRREFHFSNMLFDTGGNVSKSSHIFYLHGRPNAWSFVNNVRCYGPDDSSQVKSTTNTRVLNCYLSTLKDPTNPAAIDPATGTYYKRPTELIDIINVTDTQIYNNHLIVAMNPAVPTSGTRSGGIYWRCRREVWGCDIPPYPQPWSNQFVKQTPPAEDILHPISDVDDAWASGATIIINASQILTGTLIPNAGYFSGDPRLNGWPDTTATTKDDAFWTAVKAKPITDETNPFTFKHYISYNTFQFVQENPPPDNGTYEAIRNDGTHPRYAYEQFKLSVIVRVAAEWCERSVDFLANNTFTGFWSYTDADLFNYNDTDALDTLHAADTGPNPRPGSKWPRSENLADNELPRHVLVGGNGMGAAVTPVALPAWFKIGGAGTTGTAPETESVLHAAATNPSFVSGWSSPLAVPDLAVETVRLNTEDTLAYPDVSSVKPTWHWSSKWCWDPTSRRALAVVSPHVELSNLRAQLLVVYDEATNKFVAFENPGMRSFGHCFDSNGLDVAGRRLYKWSNPKSYVTDTPPPAAYDPPFDYITYPTTQYIQPQMIVLDIDAIDLFDSTSVLDGGALIKEIARTAGDAAMQNSTAPAVDVWPGVGVCLYSKDRVWILDQTTETWSASISTGESITAFHNVGHYNPTANRFIFGGGSYSVTADYNQKWFMLNPNLTITRLDDSPMRTWLAIPTPVVMSVNNDNQDHKCCATYIPGTNKSVFFHQDGNIYTLDPFAAPGSQWTVTMGGMAGDPNNGSQDDRWCCTLPDHNCILVGHWGAGGTSKLRLWKP